ncbi:MAG: ammonium transporter [Chromatiaceae bacterium]
MGDVAVVDILWVLASSVLVLLMQGGFLCVESGLTRSKNAINVALKNASDFLIAALAWYLVGFGLMFGTDHRGWIGSDRFLPTLGHDNPWEATFFIFQLAFCATAATIVSGAVAERMRFNGYHVTTLLVVALIYPVFGHWAWGGTLIGDSGWLKQLGFVDFAGSTVVHSVGGWVALAAVLVIGPRTGRFVDGESRIISGSDLPLAMLGVMFFVVGWIGFNGGSTLALSSAVPSIVANTLLSAAAGGTAAYVAVKWLRSSHLDQVAVPLNGIIAGLVAVTAVCHAVSAAQSIIIGATGGLVMVYFTDWLARRRIDDAIGAIPVHLAAGAWGTLAVALFAEPAQLGTGLSTMQQLGVQLLGIAACGVWSFGVAYPLLRLYDHFWPLRIDSQGEQIGLNVAEHGAKTELIDLMHAMTRQEHTADLSLRVPVEPFTEVGQIASQHNRLMDALEQAVTHSQTIVRNLRDGILTFSSEGRLTSLNPGAEKILGVQATDAIGRCISGFLDLRQPPLDRTAAGSERRCTGIERLLREDKLELPLRDNLGDQTFVELTITANHPHEGGYTCLLRDITDRRHVEEQLFEEKELAQTTLESIADGVITTDRQGRIRYMNAVAVQFTGKRLQEALGQPLHKVFTVVDSPTEMPSDWVVQRVLREGKSVIEAKSRLLYCHDGNVHAVQHTAAPIRNRSGDVTGVVVVFHDITQARAMERKLSYQAKHDGLTGLINRTEFEARLGELIDSLGPGPAQHLLCYIDLDQFKLVNDVCGHAAGDALLRQVAGLLKRGLRSADTLARLGGDEFGVILANSPIERGVEIAEAMRERVRDFRFPWGGKQFAIGASVGLVPLSQSLGNLQDALSRADAACYAAKDSGRNRVHVYDPDDRELTLRKGQMKWISRIQRALDTDGFRLYFQTIAPVDRVGEDAGYFEVLLRMIDDDGTDIPPGAFIPAAERYGLMPEIDEWVVRNTLRWLSAYEQSGGDDIYRCSINLSGATLGNDKHTARIRDYLQEFAIAPGRICFEITETAAMSNFEQAGQFIHELKQTGCRFALDDFGSGLSSFGYLKNLAVDFVKIDGSFIRDIDRRAVDREIVEAITSIARVMGLKSIAEFVETAAALDLLREIGVDYAQGFHVARPMPLDDYPGLQRLAQAGIPPAKAAR